MTTNIKNGSSRQLTKVVGVDANGKGGIATVQSLTSAINPILYAQGVTIQDGASHPLSSVFSTLSAAQLVYPRAVALTDEFGWHAIMAALDSQVASGGQVSIPYGNIGIHKPIILTYNQVLEVCGGASIIALASFTGSGVVMTLATNASSSPTNNMRVTGTGTLDGNMLANYGVDMPWARFGEISNLKITRCLLGSVVVGSDTTTSYASSDIKVMFIRGWFNESDKTYPLNDPNSIGIHMVNCTDWDIISNEIIGYRRSFVTESSAGSGRIVEGNHGWNRATHGSLQCVADIGGGDCIIDSLDVDTPFSSIADALPTVYGIRVRSTAARATITKTRFFAPSGATSATQPIAIQLDGAGSQCTIRDIRVVGSSGYYWASHFGGSYSDGSVLIDGINDNGFVTDTTSRSNRLGGASQSRYASQATYGSRVYINGDLYQYSGLVHISTANAAIRDVIFETNSVPRFKLRTNSTAETGNNVGSDIEFIPYSDTGVAGNTAIKITRATSGVALTAPLKLGVFSVATLPVGNNYGYGSLIVISDGNAGTQCLGFWDNNTWRRIVLGATANTTS